MPDIKFSALWAIIGVLIAISAFSIDFWLLRETLPGYKVLFGPGIITARLFSEEIDFWPKLGLMLIGQYCSYFVVILTVTRLIKIGKKKCSFKKQI